MAGKETETEEWPDITREERIQHETLFYSQGPLNGFLTGERARDLFLHSRLPLTVLSQIWNLADSSNDNLLDADEFVTAMHLIQGILQGKKVPKALPKNLVIKKSPNVSLPSMCDREKEAYLKVFQSYDVARKGFIDGTNAIGLFNVSKLAAEQLADVWNWSDVNRDGHLDPDEWAVACHLLRHLKTEEFKLEGTVDIFTYLPNRISPTSLKARKDSVDQYERHKQRLMHLKEKRKTQITRESRRLQLLKEKSDLEKELFKLVQKSQGNSITEEEFSKSSSYTAESIEKLEEIVARLKKEHEKVRQETVQAILGEQKLQTELRSLKTETDELNKRLSTSHTKATKDPDPFHQLYEQRKEERKKSNLSEGEEPEIHFPFQLNPFDKESLQKVSVSGSHLFLNSHTNDNNNTKISPENQTLFEDLHEFGEKFVELWCPPTKSSSGVNMSEQVTEEEDSIFMTVEVNREDDKWLGVGWKDDCLQGLSDTGFISLHRKLVDLKAEMQKLNGEAGGKMIFRNPSDYLARKKEKEEEEKKEKSKYPRRSKSSVEKDYTAKHRRYAFVKNLDSDASEKRLDHRSYKVEYREKSRAPDRPTHPPIRHSDSHIPRASSRPDKARPLSADVTPLSDSPTKSVSPSTSPTRLSSTKKTRAPAPPTSLVTKAEPQAPLKESKLPVRVETPERPPRKKDSGSPTSPAKPLESTASLNDKVTEGNNQTDTGVRKSFLFGYQRDEEVKQLNDRSDVKVNSELNDSQKNVTTVIKLGVNVNEDSVTDRTSPVISTKVEVKGDSDKPVDPPVKKVDPVEEVKVVPDTEEQVQNSSVYVKTVTQVEVPQKSHDSYPEEPLDEDVNSEITEHSPEVVNLNIEIKNQNPDQISVSDIEATELEEDIVPTISKDRLSLDIPSSDTVSLCSTDSIPPALPDSKPPDLPVLPGVSSPIQEEVVEIVTSPRVESTPPFEPEISTYTKEEVVTVESDPPSSTLAPVVEDIIEVVSTNTVESAPQSEPDLQTESKHDTVSSDQNEKQEVLTVSQLKEKFFGRKVHTMSVEGVIAVDEPLPQTNGGGSLDVYMNDFKLEANMKKVADEDNDSDLSDAEEENGNFEGTFTPGENNTGNVPTSVYDGEGEDDGIQLISFNTTANSGQSIQSPASQTDSAFDEMMSSMHSNDLDNSNQVSLSNTLDDFQDSLITESVEEVKVNQVESEPQVVSLVDIQDVSEEKPQVTMETQDIFKEIETVPEVTQQVSMETKEKPEETELVTVETQIILQKTYQSENTTPTRPKDTKVVVKKGQQLSEALSQPPKLTIRATSKDMSEEHIQEVDRQRKAVISESTVKRRGITDLSTSKIMGYEDDDDNTSRTLEYDDNDDDDNKVVDVKSSVKLEDNDVTVEPSFNTSLKSSIKWEDKPDKVDLYSHNIVQEDGNTESVDRESIADLSSTRRQWESMVTSTKREDIQKPKPKKSGAVKHWEVKLPYKPVGSTEVSDTVSQVASPPTESEPKSVSFKMDEDLYANESAIEREIRLANEREEMLRKEQEERMELMNRQNASKKMVTPQTFEQTENNNTEFKAMYHEMTEADRGSELMKRETIIQQEIEEQKERENALKESPPSVVQDEEETPSTESLIAKEIRLQKEREEEIYKQREIETPPKPEVVETPQTQVTQMSEPEINGERPKEVSYEEAIGTYQHEGESLIARELREAREREEEVRRMRERNAQTYQKPAAQQSTPKPPQEAKPKVKPPSPSVQTPVISSQSRTVKVQPLSDSPANDVKAEKPRAETPIEREIRLARERENEFRSQKGLPLLQPIVKTEEVHSEKPKPTTDTSNEPLIQNYRKQNEESSSKGRRYASSSLQRELQKQKEREHQLRTEGVIKSTSEDHIGTLSYVEVAGIPVGGPVKRNFTTRKSTSSLPTGDSPDSSKTPSENGDVEPVKPPQPQVSKGEPLRSKPIVVKGGGASFSYRESRHKAESKIEKELREMREREEELKKMREESGIVSPRGSESQNGQTVGSRKAQFEVGGK